MKVALLLCTYNRPQYLKQCLWSLERADLSKINQVLIADDCSDDNDTIKLISDFKSKYQFPFINGTQSNRNQGIKTQLLMSYEFLFSTNDIVINLDSDVIVRPDFVERLLENYQPGKILTGFHCITKNSNGTDRHKLLYEENNLYFKQSVGGINLCIDKVCYVNFVRSGLHSPHNWDHYSCIYAGGAYSLKESVIQHIGFESSMNHTEQPDIADDFYYWDLPSVTLLGVDSNKERLDKAKEKCTKWIKFGAVVTVNPNISSKEQYSEFIIKQAYKLVKTEHCLIFQHDGFVNNWQAWDNDWLQYDYIGAPWNYTDGMAVGNGGFSLRSRILMEICATDPLITILHPEDHHICRTYRPYLEKKYGIKFAPIEVAEKFSFEGYRQPGKYLKDQFGVHGSHPRLAPSTGRKSESFIVNQFLSLGDILFLIPMIRELMWEGNKILWPIDDKYFSIAKHFPDIPFVNKNDYPYLPYESRIIAQTEFGKMLPYRFASENMGRTLHQCMESKYHLYGHDHNIWRALYWVRDYNNEKRLIQILDLPKKFVLVNTTFGHDGSLNIKLDLQTDLPIIKMRFINGFTLIDWLGVIELANEVHMSNSSLNYLLELSNYIIPIHIYKRNIWGENGFEYTRHLFKNKNFIYHE